MHFVKMVSAKKGKILSQDGKVVAYIDECVDKYTGHIIGFTHLGGINDDLMKLENIAKQVLALMVRALLFKLEFPYAHFSTNGITADLPFPIVWEAIRLLESGGLRVLCVTADGAKRHLSHS